MVASGQTFRGGINGTVTDRTGAAIANATVVAVQTDTGATHSTVSSSAGGFLLQDLPLGTYSVTVGFSGFQTYHSALVPSLATTDPRLAAIGRRLEAAGVRLRPLRLEDYTGELERIHAVSAEAFVPNVLYTPLPRTEFLGMYQPLRPHVQAPLAWIAERDARMVGFVFSLPDLLQAQRGEPVDTLVVKTIARLPEPGLSGLGRLLMARLHAEARGLGFRRAIHALFHDQNVSGTLGEHSRIIRRYALYAKELA